MIRTILLGSLCAFLTTAFVAPAAAETANLLGVFGNWSAYSTGTDSSMTCYVLSKPRVYLIVSDWPGRKVKGEIEIVPGYEYKANTLATLGIGPDKFTFFSRNEAKNGTAWLQSLTDSDRLVDTMAKGVSAVATGTSSRGTKTIDTYSLQGFNDGLAKIHAVCKM
jgi:hypothetical protein